MKIKFTLLFILLSSLGILIRAQEVNNITYPRKTISTINQEEINQFLVHYYNELERDDISLQLLFMRSTNVSYHYTFGILYKHLPLLHATIKVNMDRQGTILSVKREYMDLSLLNQFDIDAQLLSWQKAIWKDSLLNNSNGNGETKTSDYKIYYSNDQAIIALEINTWSPTKDYTYVFDIRGNKIFEEDHSLHVLKDSLVNVRIFNPDPITTSGQSYGGIYADHGDSNLSWMNAQYVDTTMMATFDTGTNLFYLENHYTLMDDIQLPSEPVPTSTIPQFIFDRSQAGFEDVNAMYHISAFHNYISSVGYDTLMDMQLLIDTHAQFGADNSVFNRNGGNPNIQFGEGGVDDAEDADVIIHEYSHALSWSANNNSFNTFDRKGLDEGLGDYFATSYSRSINAFNWEYMFSWDGPVWGGRTAVTSANYPVSGTDIYKVGEVWNCAMSAIWTDLGNIVTDKLMLEAMHFFTDATSLPEAAIYILQSDTILFGGMHSNIICDHFKNKNILDANCHPVGLIETPMHGQMTLLNSLGFAQNSGDAKIIFPELCSGNYMLLDMNGKIVRQIKFANKSEILISPTSLSSGVYLLKVSTNNKVNMFKLHRF